MDQLPTGPTFGLHKGLSRESWALVWLPAFAAERLYHDSTKEARLWGTLWKRRGHTDFRWFDPLSTSEDHALGLIQKALSFSPRFAANHQGGDFYAVPIRYCLRVPGRTVHRRLRDLLVEFGLSHNLELAMAKVEQALVTGTGFPPKTAAWWRSLLAGGVVVPVPVHRRVVVSDLVPSRRVTGEEAIL